MQELKDLTASITAAVAMLQEKIKQAGYKIEGVNTVQDETVIELKPETPVADDPIAPTSALMDAIKAEEAVDGKLEDLVPSFGQALADAGFVTAAAAAQAVKVTPQVEALPGMTPMGFPAQPFADARDKDDGYTVPGTGTFMSQAEYKVLRAIMDKHVANRDEFCKAAKGAIFGLKSEDLKTFYATQRKIRMADGTWPKPVNPSVYKSRKVKAKEPTVAPTIAEAIAVQANGLIAPPDVQPLPIHQEPGFVGVVVAGLPAKEVAIAGDKPTTFEDAGITVEHGSMPALITDSPVEAATDPLTNAIPTFQEQVQKLRQAELDIAMNPKVAKIEGQVAMDAAGDKHNTLLQLARTTARALGQHGPISVDEVTAEMSKTSNVLPSAGKIHKWKGKIFNKSEWVWIGTKATSMVSSHARSVGLWALKTWIRDNTLNGTAASVSSYSLFGIYKDMSRLHTTRIKVEAEKFDWYVGDENLSPELRANISKDDNALYGIPVSFIPGAVGALLLPPNPKAGIEQKV